MKNKGFIVQKIFIFLILIFLSCVTACAFDKNFPNQINNTDFVNGGELQYDLKSYKYDNAKDIYYVDVMYEFDPGGDMEDIKCPYGAGNITHKIFSTKYSPKQKFFEASYKGFACSILEFEYKDSRPISSHHVYKGVFYNNNTHLIPNFNMDYFENLKKRINKTNEYQYNYFGFVRNIKK